MTVMGLHVFGSTYQFGEEINGEKVQKEAHLSGMIKQEVDKMPAGSEPIWPVVEESIFYNGDAYLELNNLSPKEKEEEHQFGKYITKGNVTE
jgi:hypothetical protein